MNLFLNILTVNYVPFFFLCVDISSFPSNLHTLLFSFPPSQQLCPTTFFSGTSPHKTSWFICTFLVFVVTLEYVLSSKDLEPASTKKKNLVFLFFLHSQFTQHNIFQFHLFISKFHDYIFSGVNSILYYICTTFSLFIHQLKNIQTVDILYILLIESQ